MKMIIENGLHIYLDLGNKPARILRGTNNILTEERYPKLLVQNSDYQNFILHFIDHFSRRYGKDEVNQWYFECWYDYEAPAKNAKKQYEDWFCMLYDVIKKYAPKAKIGGIGDMAEPLYQLSLIHILQNTETPHPGHNRTQSLFFSHRPLFTPPNPSIKTLFVLIIHEF